MTRFVLLATQRSGSTWVIDMLNSHPHVVAYSELFVGGGRGTPTWGGAKDRSFWDERRSERGVREGSARAVVELFRYLEDLYARRDEVDAVGVKIMYGQARARRGLVPYLLLRRVAIVHLLRNNLLDMVISREVAAARDVYHARIGEDVPQDEVRLDTTTLLDELARHERERQRMRERFRRLRVPYREVSYEELSANPTYFAGLLMDLSVREPERPLASSLRRVIERPHQDVVGNYEDVVHLLTGTRFEPFLNSALPAEHPLGA